MELAKMTAIVSGAGRGMGRAFAQELAKVGVTVAICDLGMDGRSFGFQLGNDRLHRPDNLTGRIISQQLFLRRFG